MLTLFTSIKPHHILIPDNGGWYSSSHWHTGMTHPPAQWPTGDSAGSWRWLSGTARSSSHTSDSCPSAEPQQGSNYSKLSLPPRHQGFFSPVKKGKKNLCPIFVILLRGMQRGGERVQGGRNSLSVWTFVLKRTWSWTSIVVLCGQDYVQFWVHGSVWALFEEIPDLWGPGISVLWLHGRRGNAGECRCQ